MTQPEAFPTSVPPGDLLRRASLFLDFDGTRVEIAPEPDAVQVGPRVAEITRRLAERLEGYPVRITQLAHGLPVGGELDYLDEGTLAQAIRARRPV